MTREYKMLQRIFAGGYTHANRIYDGKVCDFNPMTGEEAPMNDDCRKSDEALDMAIKIFKSRDSNV